MKTDKVDGNCDSAAGKGRTRDSEPNWRECGQKNDSGDSIGIQSPI